MFYHGVYVVFPRLFPSQGRNKPGGFGILGVLRIGYFGVVADFKFQTFPDGTDFQRCGYFMRLCYWSVYAYYVPVHMGDFIFQDIM